MNKVRIGIGYTGNILRERNNGGKVRFKGQDKKLATKSHSIANSIISMKNRKFAKTNIDIGYARLDTGNSYGENKRKLVLSSFDLIYVLKEDVDLVKNLPYLKGKIIEYDLSSEVFSNMHKGKSLSRKLADLIKYNELRKEPGSEERDRVIYYCDAYNAFELEKKIQEHKVDSFESFLKYQSMKTLYICDENKGDLIDKLIKHCKANIEELIKREKYLKDMAVETKEIIQEQELNIKKLSKEYRKYK